MNKNYLNSKLKKANRIFLKQSVLALFFMLSVSFAYAQQTITITTTSISSNWAMNFQNSGGTPLSWLATGSGIPNLTGTGNNPSFDFSVNDGSPITITITSNEDFDFVTEIFASAKDITSIDIANIESLVKLELPNNALTTIDLSTNINLTRLLLSNNSLSTIDLTTNTLLVNLELQINNLSSLDLSTNLDLERLNASVNNLSSINLLSNTNLLFLDVSSNQLTTLNLSNNSSLSQINLLSNLLTTAAIGQVLIDVEAYGTGAFGYILDLRGNPGDIPASAIPARDNLEGRGWIVRPPSIYDFGDAPNSYGTDRASGGPQHIIGDGDLNLGLIFDDELDGFPSPNADGDDLDKQDDEDGVTIADLAGILTSTDTFSVVVDITNNTSGTGNLYGWIDFDGSGTFDADEFASVVVPNGGFGTATLTWTNIIANGINASSLTFARFRITTEVLASNQSGGVINNGEVEDYPLSIELDTDGDGVGDTSDLDADNDGILNTDEIGDTNGNGIDDMLELDSDGDTCLDVTEAGYTDADADGILGTSPVVVDANGLITDDALGPIGGNGFTTPNDLDVNGTYDFQEAGAAATITTEPTDQDLIIGASTFSVVATADTYQWEESQDGGTTWVALVDGGDYVGTTTADLIVTNSDVSKLLYRYRVLVNNIAFACDPVSTSVEVTYITPDDFDLDGVFDIVDVDDDNDGILDTVEENGDINRDTDGDGFVDRIDLDADGDGCFDVTEAGFTDNGVGMLGTSNPPTVDATGLVTSAIDGYTPPNDLNTSGSPDFQEAGAAANIITQPVDQTFVLAGNSIFTVVSDLVAGNESYQWEESIDNGVTWNALVEGGDYSGTLTSDLTIFNADFTKVNYRYRVLVSNIAYACDPITISTDVSFITPGDFDKDTIFDIVDVDDDNDGILDVDEDNGIVDRDTDGDGFPDRIDLDADGDTCFDVTEAGFIDNNGDGMLGDFPVTVDANGQVTSGTDGYTPPNDLDGNGTPDFQEAGAAATITAQPTPQDLIIGVNTFNVVATADTFQWEESQDNGTTWVALVDGGDYAGVTTADLLVTNTDVSKVNYLYRVIVSNIAFACDPKTTSTVVGFNSPTDTDGDLIFDIVDVDDDNDGILDTVEDNGIVDRDTDGDGVPDRIELDSDKDGCFDVDEAGFTNNGVNMLGTSNPPVVDATGLVTSATDGYTLPNDLDGNGTPDFQEAGAAPTIATQPIDASIIITQNATFTVVGAAHTYQWQEDKNDGSGFVNIVDDAVYGGATTTTLTIQTPDLTMDGYVYRVVLNNPQYACDPTTNSDEVKLGIFASDFDGDGIPDLLDLDADNDGILDTVEGNTTDTSGDGNFDKLNLDSDGDLCFDAVEAGFTDPDGDGYLGTSPVTVDANGQVIGQGGYTTPNDLDGNGVFDFQEAGSAAIISVDPVDQDFILNGSAIFTVTSTGDTYQWEESTDGTNWNTLSDDGTYSGTTTASMTVSGLLIPNYFSSYRVVVSSISYACDNGTTSLSATYHTLDDTDKDGVFDIVDLDDDNDGILDTVEGEGDTNGDGILDRLSLDADGDNCPDVTEAGFTNNGNDMLGTANPPVVDADGIVTSATDGYTTPNDLDGNGLFDFQQHGAPSEVVSQPEDMEIGLGDNLEFTITANATYLQWQVSTDNGSNWSDLSNDDKYDGVTTSTLSILDARARLESNLYRVRLTSPDYACDPNPELYSREALLSFDALLIPNAFTPNGDGRNDLFIIPGLDQYPNWSLEIVNRYGSRVYTYSNKGSANPQWWDGYSSGDLNLGNDRVPAGTYFYILNFNGDNRKPVNGWVYITY